ncbi:unnamed protein product, partial [Allacma fusca]
TNGNDTNTFDNSAFIIVLQLQAVTRGHSGQINLRYLSTYVISHKSFVSSCNDLAHCADPHEDRLQIIIHLVSISRLPFISRRRLIKD